MSFCHLLIGVNEAATVYSVAVSALSIVFKGRSWYLLIDPQPEQKTTSTQCLGAKRLLSHGSGGVRVTLGFLPWLGHCVLLTQPDSKESLSPAHDTSVRCEPWREPCGKPNGSGWYHAAG